MLVRIGPKGKEAVPSRRPPRSLAVVVLAAGKGKRLKSATPKVLHPVCGRPSLWHVLRAAAALRPSSISIVVSQGADQVEEAVRSWGFKPEPGFVDQGQILGTGHAVAVTEAATEGADDVLVMVGDDPLVTAEHVRDLLRLHRRKEAAAAILTAVLDDPRGYGRVIREGDELVKIVEEVEADSAVRQIREVSTLVYAFRREELFKALPLVGRENRLREYYLPDVLTILRDKGERVAVIPVDLGGSLGMNTRKQMAAVSRIMRTRFIEEHMANGVTFVDPGSTYLDVGIRIGRDTVIRPNTSLEGATRIGSGCLIGPSTLISDSTVGDRSEVTFSVVRGSRLDDGVAVGPFASLRPGTVLKQGAKAGTFVELKKSRIGRGSKVPHLTYVGDAVVGEDSNIGAGTITVNYDGYDKHLTVIGDRAFIGSDTMLIAPVRVGDDANTGAGSVISRDVPAGSLAVERSEQRIVPGYRNRKRAAREATAADHPDRGRARSRKRQDRKDPGGGGGRG
jgi:bifunctional UDP-N-acetylglucosamine pyrophosphorylase / glucosamine-1-phosphate N-acetyltransferase